MDRYSIKSDSFRLSLTTTALYQHPQIKVKLTHGVIHISAGTFMREDAPLSGVVSFPHPKIACRHNDAASLICSVIDRMALHPAETGAGLDAGIAQMAALAEIAIGVTDTEHLQNVAVSNRIISLASPTGVEPVSSP